MLHAGLGRSEGTLVACLGVDGEPVKIVNRDERKVTSEYI